MKFPVLWSGLCCCTVKFSEILAHIKLLYNPRVNKVFTSHLTSLHFYYYLCVAKTCIARTYYLNLIYFCRKYSIFTKFYEFTLEKELKCANYALAVLVFLKNILFAPIMHNPLSPNTFTTTFYHIKISRSDLRL